MRATFDESRPSGLARLVEGAQAAGALTRIAKAPELEEPEGDYF